MNPLTALLIAGLLIAANAFFVAAEFALISVRRSQIEPLATTSKTARVALRAIENVTLVMAAAQLGVTAASLGLGAVAEPAVAHLLTPAFAHLGMPETLVHPVAFTLALAVVVYLHVVLGEMVPKNITLAGPDRAALLLAPPMIALVTVLRPFVVTLNGIANVVLRLLRVEARDEVAAAFTRDEVAAIVDESATEGMLGADEYDRLAGALGFTERTIESVLLPVESLVTIRRGATVAEVEATLASTGFSRYPVCDTDGTLLGYVHIKDVLETDPAKQQSRIEDKRIRPFAALRPGDLLHDALTALQRRGSHMGQVVTDDGTVLGLVALEDVLEELVGEIRDAAHA